MTTGDTPRSATSETIIRSGTRLARDSLLSFAGYAVPLLVAVVAIPVTARALGPVRFGLLGLAWTLVEYLSFVDLSIGRTSVRFVAEGLALRSRELRQTVSVALAVQGTAASVAAIAVALLAERLAFHVFTIPPEGRAEAAAMFVAVAANLAVVILIGAVRGVLEGAQRFAASNALKIPSATAAVLVPAIGAPLGLSLPAIMWLALGVRALVLVFAFAAVPRALPDFAWEIPRDWRLLRRMFGYSAWLAVSGVINPLLATFDRLMLARIAGSAAVGFYTAPYEAATRLLAVAVSSFLVLFPAITGEFARREQWRTQRVLESTLRQILLVFAVPVVVLFAFAPEILHLWLGPTFGGQGTAAFRILLLGVLCNALAHVPFVYLYAAGRPDLPAKNHIFELSFHVPLTLLLIGRYGITGAATAWTIRVVIDSLLLGWMAARRDAFAAGRHAAHLWRAALAAVAVLATGAAAAGALGGLGALPIALVTLTLGLYASFAWLRALSAEERAAWLGLLRSFAGGART